MATNNSINTGSGRVLQQATKTSTSTGSTSAVIPLDSTIPQNTEGTEWDTLSFTPKSATSNILIEFTAIIDGSNAGTGGLTLFVDSTASAIGASLFTPFGMDYPNTQVVRCVVASGSTSARTYKVRYGGNATTTYINRRQSNATIFGNIQQTVLSITEIEV